MVRSWYSLLGCSFPFAVLHLPALLSQLHPVIILYLWTIPFGVGLFFLKKRISLSSVRR